MADGTTTITIDADAAKYLAEAVKATKANKQVAKSASEIGKELGTAGNVAQEVVGRITSLGKATVIVGTAAAVVTGTWDTWLKRLENAKRLMEEIQQGVQQAAGPAVGADTAKMRTRLSSYVGTLKIDERANVAAAYSRAAPGSSPDAIAAAVQEADLASQAGLDASEYAKTRADLRFLGASAGSATSSILSKGGDQADQIAGILKTLSGSQSADQLTKLVPALLQAAQAPGGIGAVGQAASFFSANGLKGDFHKMLLTQGAGLGVSLENQPALRKAQALMRQPGEALVSAADLAASANLDPTTRLLNIRRTAEAEKGLVDIRERAGASAKWQAAQDLNEMANRNAPGFVRSALTPFTYADIATNNVGSYLGSDADSAAWTRARQSFQAADAMSLQQHQESLDRNTRALEQQKRLSRANGETP